MRHMYEGQLQRHFAGEVESADGKDFLLDINEFSTRRQQPAFPLFGLFLFPDAVFAVVPTPVRLCDPALSECAANTVLPFRMVVEIRDFRV